MSSATTAAMFNHKAGSCPMLTSDNYRQWSIAVSFILDATGAWKIVQGTELPPVAPERPNATHEKKIDSYHSRRAQAAAIIYGSLTTEMHTYIDMERDPAAMWNILRAQLDTAATRAAPLQLMKEFYKERFPSNGSINAYITTLLEYQNRLTMTDYALSDRTLIAHILASLPTSYNSIVDIISNQPPEQQTKSHIFTSLRIHEMKMAQRAAETSTVMVATNSQTTTSEEDTHKTNRGYRGRGRGGYRGRGRGRRNAPYISKPPICWYCTKEGHKQDECKIKEQAEKLKEKMKKKSSNAKVANTESSNTASSNAAFASSKLFMVQAAYTHKTLNSDYNSKIWYIDSGASDHMTTSLSDFSSVQTLTKPHPVTLGDNRIIFAKAIGTITAKSAAAIFTLKNVLYVPDLGCKLISVGAADDTGCRTTSEGGICEMWGPLVKGKRSLWIRAKKEAKMYCANVSIVKQHSAQVNIVQATPYLWHRRLGHLNMQSVRSLVNIPKPLPANSERDRDSICEPCLQGKQHVQVNRSPPTQRTSQPLELIHSDLCGPISPPTSSGSRYFLIYIDDFTRMCWIYFLQSKNATDVTDIFMDFKNLVESSEIARKGGYMIRRFRCDNGTGEYDNRHFKSVLQKSAITFEPSAPYTQHQNGVSERKIRSISETVRSMLFDSKLPKELWAEAASTSVYLLNRSPTQALDSRTPYEAWFQQKPNLSHLRVFGCTVYVHIPKAKRSKLDSKSQKCTFLGYVHNTTKLWRVMDPLTQRVFNVADAVFDENTPGGNTAKSTPDLSDRIVELSDSLLQNSGSSSDSPAQSTQSMSSSASSAQPTQISSFSDISAQPISRQPPRIELGEEITDNAPAQAASRAALTYAALFGDSEYVTSCYLALDILPQITPDEGRFEALDVLVDALRGSSLSTQSNALQVSVKEAVSEPTSYRQALQSPDWAQWKIAMSEEYDSLISNHTWELVEVPPSSKGVIGCKWVYKKKQNADGSTRFKARLVIKGYEQIEGIDYYETFAPVPKFATIRMLMALATEHNWDISQLDVVTAFLHPSLDEEVYMEQPEGFRIGNEGFRTGNRVCQLRKALYGLKQAPRVWYSDIDTFLTSSSIGFTRSQHDPNLYITSALLLLLWVDDILIFSSKSALEAKIVKDQLMSKYKMKDLGEARVFIGIEIERDRQHRTMRLHQSKYIASVLEHFSMHKCNGAITPLDPNIRLSAEQSTSEHVAPEPAKIKEYQSLVGKLMYAMLGTRPDLAFAVSTLGRFSSAPSAIHATAAKRAIRYIKQSQSYGLVYSSTDSTGSTGSKITGFSDSDWAGDMDSRRSTTGYVFLLAGAAISWKSRRQPTVALSTTEAEYMALTEACKEGIWLQRLYAEVRQMRPEMQVIRVDNQGAMDLAKNPKHHDRTKHIAIRHHFVREAIEAKTVAVQYIQTDENTADILTKALPREKHTKHTEGLGVKEQP